MEGAPQIANTSPEDKKALLGNIIQLQLADRHGEDPEVFIDAHAATFRSILNQHPEFFDEYERNPDEVLGKLEKDIYH